ncbi:MAG: hypothetical protein ACREQV_04505, partial [Candidatus Binatia bacterium]
MSIEITDDVVLAALKAGPEAWINLTKHLRKSGKPCRVSSEDLQGVNFAGLNFPTHARFDGCFFSDAKFRATVFEQGASFVDCTFNGLTEINMHTGAGDLSFDRATFEGPLAVHHFGAMRSISFAGARFQQGLSARGLDKQHPLNWPTLHFQQAH